LNSIDSQKLFSFREHGGLQEDGGIIRQIPYFSACGRMLEMYPIASLNSSSVGVKMGASSISGLCDSPGCHFPHVYPKNRRERMKAA